MPEYRLLPLAIVSAFLTLPANGQEPVAPTGPAPVAPIPAEPAPEAAQPPFPFVIPWDDATDSATSVAFLNPAPLTEKSRIAVRGGHFVDATGRRVRFLGCNFTFNANFPEHADAEKVAARMHKLGFNIVRLHHMDTEDAPNGIWDTKAHGKLDADQLDRLDYLVNQFSKQGIYVDLNLHVARKFTARDGFEDADKLPGQGKVVDWFEPRMIALQKDYASQFLNHLNPYTGRRWGADPALALVEINNEDTLVGAALSREIDDLPTSYRSQLLAQWNRWLIRKYGSTKSMLGFWNQNRRPMGDNVLRDARFTDETPGWSLEANGGSVADFKVEDPAAEADGPSGKVAHVHVEKLGTEDWQVQLSQRGLDLAAGGYTLSFWAKSDVPRTITAYSGIDQDPWNHTGLTATLNVTPTWKRFRLPFQLSEPVAGHNRVVFICGGTTGNVYLADTALNTGNKLQMEPGKSLEAGTMDFPVVDATTSGSDYIQFLMDVESAYSQGMKAYIHDDLKTVAPVTCSQASYGGLAGLARESAMDYVDMHAYWQHPRFPHKSWDAVDWNIPNTAMVNDKNGGTLWELAANRVAGKPFTVSEYNHPAPNDFSAEGLPMLAATAARQDWDGIFLFEYNGSRNAWASNKIKGFFSSDTHPGKMAFMPAAARIFLEGLIMPAVAETKLTLPQKGVAAMVATSGKTYRQAETTWRSLGVDATVLNQHRVDVALAPGGTNLTAKTMTHVAGFFPTNQTYWDTKDDKAGLFTCSDGNISVLVGFPGKETRVGAGILSVTITSSSNGFVAMTLAPIGLQHSANLAALANSLLLTIVGKVENQNMGWNADHTSVGNKWGYGPTLAEGIGCDVVVKTSWPSATVWALGKTGAHESQVPCAVHDGKLVFSTGSQHRTLWYELDGPGNN